MRPACLRLTHICTNPIKEWKDLILSFLWSWSLERTCSPLLIGCCASVGEAFILGFMDGWQSKHLGPLLFCPPQVAEHTCCLPVCSCLCLSDDSPMMQFESQKDPTPCLHCIWLVFVRLSEFSHIYTECGWRNKWNLFTGRNIQTAKYCNSTDRHTISTPTELLSENT